MRRKDTADRAKRQSSVLTTPWALQCNRITRKSIVVARISRKDLTSASLSTMPTAWIASCISDRLMVLGFPCRSAISLNYTCKDRGQKDIFRKMLTTAKAASHPSAGPV